MKHLALNAARRTLVVCAILGGLLAIADRADAQGLPGAPREDQLDAALLAHHSIIYDRGLADDRMVWFIVDANSEVLETGVGDSGGGSGGAGGPRVHRRKREPRLGDGSTEYRR